MRLAVTCLYTGWMLYYFAFRCHSSLFLVFQDNWPPVTMSLEMESTGEGNEQGKQSESFLIPRKQQVGAGH